MSIDEREWQSQEQALRDSRAGLASEGDPAYHRIADALRTAMPPQLPPDFAALVAAKAARQGLPTVDTRFEAMLTTLMTIVLVVAGMACAFAYGRDWLQPLLALLPASPSMPLRLLITIAGCAGLSWALDGLRGRSPQQR